MNDLNLQQLSIEDQKNTNGGWIGIALGTIALGVYLYDHRDRFMEGVNDALK